MEVWCGVPVYSFIYLEIFYLFFENIYKLRKLSLGIGATKEKSIKVRHLLTKALVNIPIMYPVFLIMVIHIGLLLNYEKQRHPST